MDVFKMIKIKIPINQTIQGLKDFKDDIYFSLSPTLTKRTAYDFRSHAQEVTVEGHGKDAYVSGGHSMIEMIGKLVVETTKDLKIEIKACIAKTFSVLKQYE